MIWFSTSVTPSPIYHSCWFETLKDCIMLTPVRSIQDTYQPQRHHNVKVDSYSFCLFHLELYQFMVDHFHTASINALTFVLVVWWQNCTLFDIAYHMMLIISHFVSKHPLQIKMNRLRLLISMWSTIEFEIELIKRVWMHFYPGLEL